MTQKILAILFLAATLVFLNCKKNKVPSDNQYGLPNATQTGANTFACLINGVPFISYHNAMVGAGATMIDARVSDVFQDTLAIGGSIKPNGVSPELIFLHVNGSLEVNKQYDLGSAAADGIYSSAPICVGISSLVYATSGAILITKLDTTNKIVSGFFNAVFPIPGCDTLKITEGRFDYQFQYY